MVRHKTRVWHARGPENYVGLIFGVPAAEQRCEAFSFRLELWVCEDLVAGRIPLFSIIKNEVSQGKFGYHIGAPKA